MKKVKYAFLIILGAPLFIFALVALWIKEQLRGESIDEEWHRLLFDSNLNHGQGVNPFEKNI